MFAFWGWRSSLAETLTSGHRKVKVQGAAGVPLQVAEFSCGMPPVKISSGSLSVTKSKVPKKNDMLKT